MTNTDGPPSAVAGAFSHAAHFYRGADEYVATTVPFILDGLAAGEPVAVAVPEPRLRLLGGELGSAASQVRLIDMSRDGRNPGRIIPGILRGFADAYAVHMCASSANRSGPVARRPSTRRVSSDGLVEQVCSPTRP
jgi:hypothetical protein